MPIKSLEGIHLFQVAVGITPLVLHVYAGLNHSEIQESIKHLCYGLLESALVFGTAIALEGPFHRFREYINNRYLHRNP
ncbi:hypothetical protein FJZ17_01195 [Candidatus Pacearchaeota archaeon]|nr:hypothetical protein [Candidatus Pacearchaeota archaeon]